MAGKKIKWNPPSWPWELEIITLVFFLTAAFLPYYFCRSGIVESSRDLRHFSAGSEPMSGQNLLNTQQMCIIWITAISALYGAHLIISFKEFSRITASPIHLVSPCLFVIIAYYRMDGLPNLRNTAFSSIDGSLAQVIALVLVVGLIVSILARLRSYRYLINFEDVPWDIVSPAPYDSTYRQLLTHVKPLLYAPRRYRVCNEGILVEGWFYVMPIGFDTMHAMSPMSNYNTFGTGNYFASSTKHLIRIELIDSVIPTYISPLNREEFVRYCVHQIARKRPAKNTSPSRHGILHASDTHAATETGDDPQSNSTNSPGS